MSNDQSGDARFEILAIEDLAIEGLDPGDSNELMSPYVWRNESGYCILIRAVPAGDGQPTGCIWCGVSDDGLRFRMSDKPAIAPSLEHLDIGGCEDPTVVEHGDHLTVFYTGVNREGAAEMLWATGPDAATLEKRGVAYHCSQTELNTKEATVEVGDDGIWRLFYEYSRDDRSRIGLSYGSSASGPWTDRRPDPIEPREGRWDGYHLSTGPMLDEGDELLMFYNGATEDVRWAIGWATFAHDDARQLRERCDQPLIRPDGRSSPEERDIAFANSIVVEGDLIRLYYSYDDALPRRATLRRRKPAER